MFGFTSEFKHVAMGWNSYQKSLIKILEVSQEKIHSLSEWIWIKCQDQNKRTLQGEKGPLWIQDNNDLKSLTYCDAITKVVLGIAVHFKTH